MENVRNLAVIGGDAAYILPKYFAEGCVSEVHINHPEPPEWSGGSDDSQGKHMLMPSFFRHMHRVLAPGGTVTVVTDNFRYAKSLAAIGSEVRVYEEDGQDDNSTNPLLFGSVSELADDREVSFTHEGKEVSAQVYSGTPDDYEDMAVEAGGAAEADDGAPVQSGVSYFDRLWKKGQKSKR
jgi:tRNA G46 methylase TrmB